jgi:hypothetical protein
MTTMTFVILSQKIGLWETEKIKKACPALRRAGTSKQNEKPTFIFASECSILCVIALRRGGL